MPSEQDRLEGLTDGVEPGPYYPLKDILKDCEVEEILGGQYIWVPEIGLRIARDSMEQMPKEARIGFDCIIEPEVRIGNNATIGHGCTIKQDVVVLDNLKLGDEVLLASGTRLANNVDIARGCTTTGLCFMGDHAKMRARSTLSRSVIVEPWAFIAAGIMSSHTQHISHGRPNMEPEQFISRIGYGAIIGSGAQLGAGVEVGNGAIVGYNAFVRPNSRLEAHGVYFNNPKPWATLQKKLKPENPWYIEVPEGFREHYFHPDLLKQYLSGYEIPDWLHELAKAAEERMLGILVAPANWSPPGRAVNHR
jgi:acetyltransferase-like isoleucine patch superfamily enzyme